MRFNQVSCICSHQTESKKMAAPMPMLPSSAIFFFFFFFYLILPLSLAASSPCDFTFLRGNDLYTYALARPTSDYPHGILSEDGFYKVAANDTVLWFQLCDQMIFNHDPPRCFGCEGCGGETRCGRMCTALVSTNEEGYNVCQMIGRLSTANVALIDVKNPGRGVTVNMSSSKSQIRCSLTVAVNCDPSSAQVPYSLQRLDGCNYATEMKHPSGCAMITSGHGGGWGWFGTLILILMCALGAYVLAGVIYRFFYLGIRGAEVIPNLQFFLSLPHILQNLFGSILRRINRIIQSQRSRPVNY